MIYALPNLLTYGRILAVPLLVAVMFVPGTAGRWIALAIFIAACITDYFDGWLARRWNMQSGLGRMLDPIADKLLVAAALMMLVYEQTIWGVHLAAAIVILCREILVSGLREYLAGTRLSVPVTWLAKWKTAVQMIALGFLLAGPAGDKVLPGTTMIGLIGLWIAASLTMYTGYDYLKSGIAHVVAEDSGTVETSRPGLT